MKKLFLLRHAKSSWEQPELADHERPLSPRGERSALVMGRYMAQRRLIPDIILCSTARRTVETRLLTLSQWPSEPPTEFDRKLYLSGARAIMMRLAQLDDTLRSAMVIGHNPDLQDLTLRLSAGSNMPLRSIAEAKFPTSALAVLHLPTDRWADVLHLTGILVDLETPKKLV